MPGPGFVISTDPILQSTFHPFGGGITSRPLESIFAWHKQKVFGSALQMRQAVLAVDPSSTILIPIRLWDNDSHMIIFVLSLLSDLSKVCFHAFGLRPAFQTLVVKSATRFVGVLIFAVFRDGRDPFIVRHGR